MVLSFLSLIWSCRFARSRPDGNNRAGALKTPDAATAKAGTPSGETRARRRGREAFGMRGIPALFVRASVTAAPAPSRRSVRSLALFFLALCLSGFHAGAADKSGVGPNSTSLPTGPGSATGLGESFQPDLNTGTAHYHIGIAVPPGTAGHRPGLALSYEGGNGNGPLGYGWDLGVPFVQRRTDQGMPTYGQSVGFVRPDTFITDAKEELVPLTNGYYFCKNEGAFIRYAQVGGHWEATLPNGTQLKFGLTDNGRIQDTNTARVFSWLLEQETDTHGNTITYSYSAFPGDQNRNQKYLTGVAYGPGAPPWQNFHFIAFLYADRPDWFEDCRSGFIVRTGKRLAQILVGTQGPIPAGHAAGDFNADGITDHLDRSYQLTYLNYAGTNSFWSLLAGVQETGADGVSQLPALTFGYSVCNPPAQLSAAGQIIGGMNEPPFVPGNPLVDLVDLNGDGLPDLLKTAAAGGQPTAYLNLGATTNGSGSVIQWSSPVPVGGDAQAWNVSLASTANVAFLSDMDGDGLADLVYESQTGEVFYFPNQGGASWGARRPMDAADFPLPGPFANPEVRTADFDFDKRMDVIQSVADGSGADYRIWFNLGNQQYSNGHTVAQSNGFMFSWTGVEIVDFNGDRVPDIAQIRPTGVAVTAGLGYGNFAPLVFVSLPDYTLTDQQIASAKLVDITGDGLADLVIERAVPGELWYWINLGNYTFSTRKVVTGMPTGLSPHAVTRWADMNGNGTIDLVYADATTLPRIQTVDLGQLLSGGVAPNLLLAITNGLGRVTTIGYQPATGFALADAAAGTPWPHPMPFPVQVVTAVTNSDSLGHQYAAQYAYHNPYYDPVEKQFRGFARTEAIALGDATAPTLVTRSYFDTGDVYEAMKGKMLGLTEAQADGSVFSTATNLYTTPPVALYIGTNGTNVSFASPVASTNIVTELGQGTPRVLVSAFAYDGFGNETTNADYGIVDNGNLGAFHDERIITTQFAINTNAWIIHLPARQQTADLAGNIVSRADYFYDDATFSANNLGLATTGDLTCKLVWTNPASPAVSITAARIKHDPYGNPVTLIDPLAAAPGGALDATQGHARQLAYDPDFHTYPVTETILVGGGHAPLVFQAAYDEGLGTVTNTTDFNGNQTAYAYDAFARPVSVVRPGDTAAYPTTEYSYALAQPFSLPLGSGIINYVESRQLDKPIPGSPITDHRSLYFISRQFFDGLGRALMTKSEGGTDTPGGPLHVVVNGAVLFNARQGPTRALNPFYTSLTGAGLDDLLAFESIEAPGWTGQFEANGTLASLGLAAAPQTAVTYDATLRPLTVVNPDLTFSRTVYEPLLTRSFDENESDPTSPNYNAPTVHHQDGRGRLSQIDESAHLNDDGTPNTAVQTWSTRYTYDVNDQLTSVTDSQNNTRSMQYDGLGRQTFLNDWDRGVMTYIYDAASNLIETGDAKGQRITYTYDGANRLLTEYDHDNGQPYSRNFSFNPAQPISAANRPQVACFYDNPVPGLDLGNTSTATAANTKGRLAYAWDLSGEEHHSYDARGRSSYIVKRVLDPIHGQLASFTTSFDYDSVDRVTALTYPDNDAIGYQYNDRSLLAQITGGPSGSLLSNLVYWPSGQEASMVCGNGVQTAYTHDARLRLNTLITAPKNTPGSPLIAFGYAFDGASNLKNIADLRPASVVAAGDPRRNSQAFQYDDLYRLTGAQYSFAAPVAAFANSGQINYRYDRIGNMLSQTSTFSDTDPRTGLPLSNLGQMASGGAAGRSNRAGRQPTDPPGPHALTQINNQQSAITNRSYAYDANGNLTNLDGLVLTWDFRDRAVAMEDAAMRADYVYDFTGRRITKRITAKPGSPLPSDGRGAGGEGATTVSYINQFYEVREFDAPTKYVFNGDVRVARVTGSLSSNTRVQRFRVSPGWNLLSLAVTAPNGGAQLSAGGVTRSAYQWNAATTNWAAANSTATLPAGTVLWVNASTNATLSVAGVYPGPPPNALAPPLGIFLPGNGLEILPLTNQPPGIELAVFSDDTQTWQSQLPPPFGDLAGFPSVLAPGGAVFAEAATATNLILPDPTLSLRYYHQDHLGSTACMTDANGNLVQEEAFYTFGAPRNTYQPRGVSEPYQLTQKEQDVESELDYFEARYLASSLGRFLSVDPLSNPVQPQSLNPYAYARNRPLVMTDPNGMDPLEVAEAGLSAIKRAIDIEQAVQRSGVTALQAGVRSSGSLTTRKAKAKLAYNIDERAHEIVKEQGHPVGFSNEENSLVKKVVNVVLNTEGLHDPNAMVYNSMLFQAARVQATKEFEEDDAAPLLPKRIDEHKAQQEAKAASIVGAAANAVLHTVGHGIHLVPGATSVVSWVAGKVYGSTDHARRSYVTFVNQK